MDFSLTEEQQMFVEMFRDFAEKEVAKVAEHTDRAEHPPLEVLKKAAAQGFLGSIVPEDYGGAALDWFMAARLVETIAKECQSTAVTLATHTGLALSVLLEGGSEEQKQTYLPRLAGGELGAFALTEPDAGSDVMSLRTRAVFADEGYRLNGVKKWVSNAGLAALVIVFARTEKDGLSAFIVEKDTPGLSLGQREPTLGLRGLDIRTVYLEDVFVPADNLIGELHTAWPLALKAFDRVRLLLAGVALGAAESALSLGIRFAIERKQFGTSIANKQAMQNYVADCAMDIEAVRHLVEHAAWLADSGQSFGHAANMAKYLAARTAANTANKMLQVHGGYGFSDEYAISRVYRDARALRLLGGTDELQRVAVAQTLFAEAGFKVQA